MISQRKDSCSDGRLKRYSTGGHEPCGVDRWRKEGMVGARNDNHFDNPALVAFRQLAGECEVDHVTERTALHQILDAIPANENLVRLDRRQGCAPERLSHLLLLKDAHVAKLTSVDVPHLQEKFLVLL